jgi:hypothetical protein
MDNNLKKKNKFVNNFNNEYNKQPYYYVPVNDNRQDQIKTNYNTKSKISMELNQHFDPYNYDLNYSNKINTNNQQFTYYAPYNQGPGRGFGNLSINNDIRNGSQSRQHADQFKVIRGSDTVDRFDYIDNRYSNPNNLVLPFPRSGETTRKLTETLSEEKNIIDYNFSKPNQVKIAYDFNEINYDFNNLPNQQIIDNAKTVGINQKKRQIEYINNLNNVQTMIDNGQVDMTSFYSNNYSSIMKNFNN